MSNLREAAQQALEALKDYKCSDDDRVSIAMHILSTALAESDRDWSLLEATQQSLREHMAEVRRLRAALEQEQEQEPNNPGECSECHAPVGSVCSDADCPGKAAPLITKPTDFVSLLREADEIVRAKPTWRRFIDGTPLSNDIAVWMVVFAQDVARRNATAALRADAERYRYLLGHARRIDVAGWSISHMEQLSPRIDAAREGS